ncbi:hypothetical protein ABW19_dt0206373 [Dactylella cylindrospora]|nr:hypothetical protein ABW19_dt0206373 [Dactylella cylindrospora]
MLEPAETSPLDGFFLTDSWTSHNGAAVFGSWSREATRVNFTVSCQPEDWIGLSDLANCCGRFGCLEKAATFTGAFGLLGRRFERNGLVGISRGPFCDVDRVSMVGSVTATSSPLSTLNRGDGFFPDGGKSLNLALLPHIFLVLYDSRIKAENC